MKCITCKNGEMKPGKASVLFDLPGGGIVVLRDVPATVCDQCGEKYFDEATTGRILKQAREAEAAGTDVQVHRYAAA